TSAVPLQLPPFPTRRSSDLSSIDDGTSALRRQIVLVPAVANEAADVLFAQPIIIGGIDKVDTGVQHGVEDAFRLLVGDRPPAPRSEEHTSELQSRFDLVCRL